MSAGATVLEAVAVSKKFGQNVVLKDLSIRFTEGRLHSILGPNGAGKTTLFNLLTKDYPVDKGDILLQGERVTKLRPDQIARKGVGRSYQITSVLRELTFFENVWLAAYRAEKNGYLGAWQNFKDRKSTEIETNRVLSEFGLEKFSDRKAGEVSYGDQRLLELAVTLATRPKILLLDEPTAGLSQRETDRIKMFIVSIKSKFTIVMIEHKMNVVMDISDEISVMNRGEIIAFGTPDEISRDEAVRRAYFGL